MHADFDLAPDGTVNPSGYGGARKGAGRKPNGYVKPEIAKDFDKAKARKDSALADLNELSYKIKSGQYVERASVQQASATLLAELGQSLRSMADNLERKFNLPPNIVADVSRFGFGSDSEFAHYLVKDIGVATVPGSSFYSDPAAAPKTVRFCFSKRDETLREADKRLGRLREDKSAG